MQVQGLLKVITLSVFNQICEGTGSAKSVHMPLLKQLNVLIIRKNLAQNPVRKPGIINQTQRRFNPERLFHHHIDKQYAVELLDRKATFFLQFHIAAQFVALEKKNHETSR